MRFPRSRHRNRVLLSTRPVSHVVPWSGIPPVCHGRRSRFVRTAFLLAVIGAVRLARTARSHWRVSLGLGGLLLEIAGHSVLTGPVRSAVDLLGLVLVLTAALKSTGPAGDRRPVMPQAAWRWHG
jgi:hypothetical protein